MARPAPLVVTVPRIRLDRELAADVRRAAASRPILAFLALELVGGLLFLWRRGPAMASTVLLVWLGLSLLGFICWWAGRHRAAHPEPDPVPRARERLLCALVVAAGLAIGTYGIHMALSGMLVLGGIGAWLVIALRRDSAGQVLRSLVRDPRPFVPLLLLVAAPRLALLGLGSLGQMLKGLPSGVGQQLMFLVMLYAAMEAVTRRRDVAAVASALVFASIHVPMNLAASDGDWAAAVGNALFYQATVGIIACLAFVRHRAPLPIGVAHSLAIA